MALRAEKIPGLRPSTLSYIKKSISEDSDVGVSSRKDFLDEENLNSADATYKVVIAT